MILSLLGFVMVLGGMSAPCMQEVEHQEVVFHEENKKLATYNDNLYQITLSADELLDYTWTNLGTYLFENINGLTGFSFNNNGDNYNFDDGDNEYIAFCTSDYADRIVIWSDTYTFTKEYKDDGDYYPSPDVEGDFVLTATFTKYADVKTAIEQDIVDNTNSMPSIADIFSQVTNVITAFVGSLGQAFTSITALFYDSANSQWTFLGVLILIGVGVGLVYGVYRIIKGLLHRV